MIETISRYITKQLILQKIISCEFEDASIYGFELIISAALTTIIIFTISIITGEIILSLVFAGIFCSLRYYGNGYHCKSFWCCTTFSVLIYIGFLLNCNEACFHSALTEAVISSVLTVIVWKLVPVVTNESNLTEEGICKSRRTVRLILTLCTAAEIVLLLSGSVVYSSAISYAVVADLVLILIYTERRKKNEKSNTEDCG